jgi:HK97 family phage major capsid protein/HK97 family phage prohead protease
MPEKRTIADLLRDVRFQDHAREATFDRATVDAKARTVELSFSSETPYKRWWGTEILSHEADAVNLERLNGGANLLVNHDWDNYVGVVDNARIDGDRRGRATVRFGSGVRAQEAWQDVQDGILRSVSVGYKIEDMVLQRDSEDTGEEYLVTKWTPYEISLVTVPADQSVGVGRSQSPAKPAKQQEDDMPEKTAPAGDTAENRKTTDMQVGIDHKAAEDSRIETIKHVCKQADIDEGVAAQWILEGVTIQQAQQRAMDVLTERHSNFKRAASNVGLSRREIQQYSISRMIEAVANKNPGKAGLENEVHQTLQQRLNRLPGEETFFLPSDKACVLVPVERGARGNSFVVPGEILSRDLATQPGSAGGYLIETANLSWIDLLRNRSVALRLGATRLTGLTGNVSIPKQTAAATAYWVTDTASITESQQTLGQLNLSPKNVGAYTEISRQLLLQSNPSAEAMVMADLAQVVGLAVDAAMLEGTGAAGAPLGIANVTGVGSVSGTSLDAADIIEFQTDVATANVLPMRPGYVTTAAAAGLLMARPELPSTGTTRLWLGNVWDGSLFGIPAMSSQQLTALSMIFGAWEHAVLAEWGVLEIEVNPYANFQAGIRGIRAMYSVDVGIRYAAAFSRATSIT